MSKVISKRHSRKKEYFPYEVLIYVEPDENPVQLRDTTLTLCKVYRIPYQKISIWIPEKKYEAIYKQILLPSSFGRFLIGQSLLETFQIGTPIIYMNSCLTGFFQHANEKKQPLKSLLEVIKLGFYECEKQNSHLWGCVPLNDKKSKLKPKISTKLRCISSVFWGCIYTGLDSHLKPYQEIERSILYYKADGKVIYLNMYGFTSCKINELKEDIQNLQFKFPDYIHLEKKDNHVRVRLKDLRSAINRTEETK